MKKKDKAINTKLYNCEFSKKNILQENYKEFANRFLKKGAEMETRLPCKVWQIQFMWLRVFFVLGARNCVNFHLFIDIIHDCCNHMTFSSFKAS